MSVPTRRRSTYYEPTQQVLLATYYELIHQAPLYLLCTYAAGAAPLTMSILTRCRPTYCEHTTRHRYTKYEHTYQVPIYLLCPYLPGADRPTMPILTRCRST